MTAGFLAGPELEAWIDERVKRYRRSGPSGRLRRWLCAAMGHEEWHLVGTRLFREHRVPGFFPWDEHRLVWGCWCGERTNHPDRNWRPWP